MKIKIPEPNFKAIGRGLILFFDATPNMFSVLYSLIAWTVKVSPLIVILYAWSNWDSIESWVDKRSSEVIAELESEKEEYKGIELTDYVKRLQNEN